MAGGRCFYEHSIIDVLRALVPKNEIVSADVLRDERVRKNISPLPRKFQLVYLRRGAAFERSHFKLVKSPFFKVPRVVVTYRINTIFSVETTESINRTALDDSKRVSVTKYTRGARPTNIVRDTNNKS